MQTCFVTGATGFVGLNLIDELLSRGWDVHALHRHNSKRAGLLTALPNNGTAGKLSLVEGDLTTDADNFALLVPGTTEVLFHICHVDESSSSIDSQRVMHQPGFQPESGAEHKRLNHIAMRNVIDAAKKRGVRRIVYCSSWSSYGRQADGTDVSESSESRAHADIPAGLCCCGPPPSPVPYFECKLELEERLCAAVAGGGGLEGVIIQPCSVFGRYGDTGWCTIFERLLESGGSMPGLPGSSSFVDAQDLAAAFVSAASAGAGRGEKYIVGGTNASNLEMQRLMAALVGTPAPRRAVPAAALRLLARWNESLLHCGLCPCLRLRVMPETIGPPWLVVKITQDQSAQSAAAQQALGYTPRPLPDSLRRNYVWLVESGKLPARENGKKTE